MEFKRINKDTVTCIITEDDMDEQGIKLEDLFERKKEAIEFLHDVMKKAQEEVDYKPTGSFMPMQITVLPDHSISLTLSENASASFGEILKNLTDKAGIKLPKTVLEDLGDSTDGEKLNRLNEYLRSLKNLQQLTNQVKDIIEENGIIQKDDNNKIEINASASVDSGKKLSDKISTGARKTGAEANDKRKLDEQKINHHECIFTFDDINAIFRLAKHISRDIGIESSLYKNSENDKYYLIIKRCEEAPEVFASVFAIIYEFGHLLFADSKVISHVEECYDCIIKEKALFKLANVVSF